MKTIFEVINRINHSCARHARIRKLLLHAAKYFANFRLLGPPGNEKYSRAANKLDRLTEQSEDERDASRNEEGKARRAASLVRESCKQHDHRGIAQATREPRRGMQRRCIKRAAALCRAEPRGKQKRKKKKQGEESAHGVDTSSRRGTLAKPGHRRRVSLSGPVIPFGPVSYGGATTILNTL